MVFIARVGVVQLCLLVLACCACAADVRPAALRDAAEPFSVVPRGPRLPPQQPLESHAQPDGDKALLYLVGQQTEQGSWPSATGEHDVAATGLALLALEEMGFTHKWNLYSQFDFKSRCRRGLAYLQRSRTQQGFLTDGLQFALRSFDHMVATWALADIADLTRDRRLVRPLPAAAAAIASLAPSQGSEGLAFAARANTLATMFGMLALRAVSSTACTQIPPDLLRSLVAQVDGATSSDGWTGYVEAGDGVSIRLYTPTEPLPLLTASALLVRGLSGVARDDPKQVVARKIVLAHPPVSMAYAPLYWYVASYGLLRTSRLDDAKVEAWFASLDNALAATQVTEGPAAGSWPSAGVIGDLCGPVGTTAMCLMARGVAVRRARILDERGY